MEDQPTAGPRCLVPVKALEADTVSRKVPTICIGSAMKQGGRSRRATTRVSPGRGGRGRTPFGPVRGVWGLGHPGSRDEIEHWFISQVEAGRARLGDRLRFIKAQAGQLALFLPTRNHVGPSGRTPSCTRTKTATAGCCCQLACGANARLNRTTVGSGHTTSALGRAASSNSAAAAASALPGRFSMRVPAAARVRWETR